VSDPSNNTPADTCTEQCSRLGKQIDTTAELKMAYQAVNTPKHDQMMAIQFLRMEEHQAAHTDSQILTYMVVHFVKQLMGEVRNRMDVNV
jgi:hypothetical protein